MADEYDEDSIDMKDDTDEGDGVNIGRTSQNTLQKSISKKDSIKKSQSLISKSTLRKTNKSPNKVSQAELSAQNEKVDEMKQVIEDLRK